ncbi:DnaD domain protein [Limosilactobacillus reuteri]|uniref:DnaD domain protein n=1 Tax=Limosilactobacillus reuteri TaxID=1598 RepID=UPI0039BEFBE0
MAQRRMFSQKVTETDKFLDMALTAQSLYFHLGMNADDDGFVGNPKSIKRMIGASEDDLKALVEKDYLIVFDDGVVVIKDWLVSNYVKKDRYTPTIYTDDMKLIGLDKNKRYQFVSDLEPERNQVGTETEPKRIQNGDKMEPECIQSGSKNENQISNKNSQPQQGQGFNSMEPNWNQNGTKMDPQVRLGKDRVKLSKSKDNLNTTTSTTLNSYYKKLASPKSQSELKAFVNELGGDVVAFAITSMFENADRPTFAYLRSILKRYQQQGLTNLAAVQHDNDVYNGKSVVVAGTKPKIPVYKLGE